MGAAQRGLRIGIITDSITERAGRAGAEIANGGIGTYTYNLVKHLQECDDGNQYVLISRGGGLLDVYHNGQSQHVALASSAAVDFGQILDRPYRAIAQRLRLDLLHYPNQYGGGFLQRRMRRVVTVHDLTPLLFPHFHPRTRVLGQRLFMGHALRAADHIIAVSAHTRSDLLARFAVAEERVSVIPHGVSTAFRPGSVTPEFSQRYDLPARFILTVGVLEPRKNHRTLVAALARLHGLGERVGLVMVGREGWGWTNPLDDPGLRHLRPWVRIHRNVPDADLAEFYNRAEVFAYPSLYEGFGMPVIEAMACGTPVVSSSAAALPEVAGGAALLFDPRDPDELARQLLIVLRDPIVRSRLSAAGLQRARALSWRAAAEATRAIYERVGVQVEAAP